MSSIPNFRLADWYRMHAKREYAAAAAKGMVVGAIPGALVWHIVLLRREDAKAEPDDHETALDVFARSILAIVEGKDGFESIDRSR